MQAEIQDAINNLSLHETTLSAYIEVLKDLRHKEFLAQGGCETCNGYGRILVWATLDGSSYDEFGPCTNANCNYKVTGVNKSKCEPGTHPRRLKPANLPVNTSEQTQVMNLGRNVYEARSTLSQVRLHWTHDKGKEVVVTRKQKAANVGDKGIIFWIGQGYDGKGKCGFKTAEGNTCWSTFASCEVTNPNVEKPKQKLIVGKVLTTSRSGAAIHFETNGKRVWLPTSRLTKLNDVGYMIPMWLAEKNAL